MTICLRFVSQDGGERDGKREGGRAHENDINYRVSPLVGFFFFCAWRLRFVLQSSTEEERGGGEGRRSESEWRQLVLDGSCFGRWDLFGVWRVRRVTVAFVPLIKRLAAFVFNDVVACEAG